MGNWQKGSRWQVVVSHHTLSRWVASQPPVKWLNTLVIDWQRLNKLGFSAVGSTPIRHLQYGRTTHSNCPTPTGLPETLYDPEWLESTDEGYHKVTLSVSRDKFEWLMFNSEDTEMMVWRRMILCRVYKVPIDNMSNGLNAWGDGDKNALTGYWGPKSKKMI